MLFTEALELLSFEHPNKKLSNNKGIRKTFRSIRNADDMRMVGLRAYDAIMDDCEPTFAVWFDRHGDDLAGRATFI